MVSDLYTTALDAKYEFIQFAVPWGRPSEEGYCHKQQAFDRCIDQFAKDCGIMAINEQFYFFTGKVYEKIPQDYVCFAYSQLMTKLGIVSGYATSVRQRKEHFLDVIINYNQLHVRNDVVAFSNKVVDLRYVNGEGKTAGTHMFDKKWHVIDYYDFPYLPQAKCPKFKRFLYEVLPEKRSRDILQMFMGLGLIQSTEAFKERNKPNRETELCLVLLGTGANGKSVLFNIMTALFGYQHITNIDYDTMTADGDEGLRGRAVIRSALFNWSSDSDPKKFGKKNASIFKKIVSGEEYPYRILGHDIERTNNCPYLIFNFNALPDNVGDGSGGFERRLQFIHFGVTIPRYQRDPHLAAKIIGSELPGIFNWVARGAMEIRRRHFFFPPSEETEKQLIKMQMPTNPVSAWIRAYSIRPDQQAPTEIGMLYSVDLMYECFKKFCENNDEDVPMSRSHFGRALSKLEFEKKRRADGIYVIVYGVTEQKLRTPMLIDMLKDTEEKRMTDKYEKDGKSYIKDD